MSYSLNALYQVVGISKQAVHQYERRQQAFNEKVSHLLIEADELRRDHPGCGVEKMYYTLHPDFIDRDRFVELMMSLEYRLKKPRNYQKTTFRGAFYYPNLIKGLKLNARSTVWQSDITYFDVAGKYYYGVFITDVYTRKVVGYQISDHLRATANVKALKMALSKEKAPLIHHSDRGSQYIYKPYIELLKTNDVQISMGICAQDNAYAERFHRTIKEEYLNYWNPKTFNSLKSMVRKAVKHYNNHRIHNELLRKSPRDFIEYWDSLTSEQRPVLTIFDDQLISNNGQL